MLMTALQGAAERRLAMSKDVLDVSMSLDGFTAGPNVREEEPMGGGGERLHTWMFGEGPDGDIDTGVRTVDASVGAAVTGRRTFVRVAHGVVRHGGCSASDASRRQDLLATTV
jgi:hypothetical protein